MKKMMQFVNLVIVFCLLIVFLTNASVNAAPQLIVKASTVSPGTSNLNDLLFDAAYYYDDNIDIARTSYGRNALSLKSHYQKYGKKEGRAPSAIFDPIYYLNKYSDLKAAFGNNYTAAYNHFVNYGIREGRQGSASFSVEIYKNNYEDLQRAYGKNGSDNWKYIMHYRVWGKNEGRNAVSSISSPESTLKISGYTVPSTLNQGYGFSVRGIISSNYTIKSVSVQILNSTGGVVTGKTVYPNSKSYDIHNIDSYVKFGLSPVGTCRYQIIASDDKNSNVYLVDRAFSVIGGSTSSVPTVFKQRNYANINYGYPNTGSAGSTVAGSGCAVVALVNAIYNLNGTISGESGVRKVAQFSLDYNCRDRRGQNGTDRSRLTRLFCNINGSQYGIQYVKCSYNWNEFTNYLKTGCVAIVGVPGHIMCVTSYNQNSGKYLLLDSAPKASRGTSSGYRWASKSELQSLNMTVAFDIIKSTR